MSKTKLNVEKIDSDFFINITDFNFMSGFYYKKLKPYLLRKFSKQTPFGVQIDTTTKEYIRFKRCWRLYIKWQAKIYNRDRSITKMEFKKIMKYGDEIIEILNIRD